MAGCTKPVKRLWISSMEDAAIREGFANLRPDSDYDALYQSALCRAKADWLVGINATRLFSVLYHKTLTVGRVQTPTLKMLVDRDAKILSLIHIYFTTLLEMINASEAREDDPEMCIRDRQGDGIALAPITGKLLAEQIVNGKESYSLDPFSPNRFLEAHN